MANGRSRSAVRLLLLVMAAGLAGGCSLGPTDSGAQGTVLLGPMCPGPARIGNPCPDQPVARTLQALRYPGGYRGPVPGRLAVAARFHSDATGRFRVALPPGDYVLFGRNDGSPDRCMGQVSVRAHAYTDITVHCDTAMR